MLAGVFVGAHIKNISPNYPRDVLQMFDKRNMTITPCASGQARQPGPWDGPAGMVRPASVAVLVCPVCVWHGPAW